MFLFHPRSKAGGESFTVQTSKLGKRGHVLRKFLANA